MTRVLSWLLPMVGLAGVWWLLTAGEPSSWLIGIPTILLAIWLSRPSASQAKRHLSLSGLLRFVPLFLIESVRGGIDVARRVMGPKLRVQPGFIDFPLRLSQPAPRLLFANCVSLLPGTLSARLDVDVLRVHALDTGAEPVREMQRLEVAVGRVYGERLR